MVIGAVGMVASHSMGLAITSAIVMALGMGVANAAVFKLVPKEVPEAVGGAAGWVGGLGAFGGFAIPPIMGLFVGEAAHDVGYATGFAVFIVLGAICLATAYTLRRAHPKQIGAQPVGSET